MSCSPLMHYSIIIESLKLPRNFVLRFGQKNLGVEGPVMNANLCPNGLICPRTFAPREKIVNSPARLQIGQFGAADHEMISLSY
ncbi:hypothetical protein NPIL_618271 [Nephila pilipes]|uniref:Uncharacterized protein n=1 Tax=Nephila pilipes TaxID=299642 RepID=A0A8X6N4J7_NEPPI|nr:hypothetical protein NPIL_618271 [Nephila pilipes]